ncbi:hypothetical protein AVEN_256774-1 [Araneus ventricosus]|uniref:Uncharacterized protein n=1 Tax=Araneus ventricosus TaxID=182803 RepID=A0A4Y2KXL3_ARAVE|nr:hypothetical protein AVEN_256774-1 [Araneus ventricosus]
MLRENSNAHFYSLLSDVVVFSEKLKPGEEEAFATYTAENVHWNRISAAPTEEYLSPQVKMKVSFYKSVAPFAVRMFESEFESDGTFLRKDLFKMRMKETVQNSTNSFLYIFTEMVLENCLRIV